MCEAPPLAALRYRPRPRPRVNVVRHDTVSRLVLVLSKALLGLVSSHFILMHILIYVDVNVNTVNRHSVTYEYLIHIMYTA